MNLKAESQQDSQEHQDYLGFTEQNSELKNSNRFKQTSANKENNRNDND